MLTRDFERRCWLVRVIGAPMNFDARPSARPTKLSSARAPGMLTDLFGLSFNSVHSNSVPNLRLVACQKFPLSLQ
jgi:hypothetical protein